MSVFAIFPKSHFCVDRASLEEGATKYWDLGPVSQSLLWKGPPLVKEGNFFSFGKATLKFRFTTSPFTSPYQTSSLKLKEGANVHASY